MQVKHKKEESTMISFNALSGTIQQKTDITEMSARDKLNLLSALMANLGITDMMRRGISFEIAYSTQSNKLWNE